LAVVLLVAVSLGAVFIYFTSPDAYACETDRAVDTSTIARMDEIVETLEAWFGQKVDIYPYVDNGTLWRAYFADEPPSPSEVERVLDGLGLGDWTALAVGPYRPEWLLIRAPGETALAAPRDGRRISEGLMGEYQIVATDAQPVTPEIQRQTCIIIANRLRESRAHVALLETLGDDLIQAWLWSDAGQDEGRLRSLIGTTGVLAVVPVPPEHDPEVASGEPLPDWLYDLAPLFTGVEVKDASRSADESGRPVLGMELKETGARLLDEWATSHPGERIAVVFDGQVIYAGRPTTVDDGRIDVPGLTQEQVDDMIVVLKYGSLPLEVREVGFQSFTAQ
jgi:hypothetical protein